MAGIKGNDSKEVVINSIVYYGGIATLRVVAINPNGDIIKQMYNLDDLKEEPKYTDIVFKDDEGNEETYNKVVIHLHGNQLVKTDKKDANGNCIKVTELIKTRIEFLVQDKLKVAKTGAPLMLNALGSHSYQSEEKMLANPKMAWFTKHTPMHHAKVGEVELLEFVRNWMNVGSKDNCNFNDFGAIARGDVKELIAMAKDRPTNEITVLLGATEKDEDKMYQSIYKKAFSRPTAKNVKDYFNKALNEAYGEFKAIYPEDLELSYVTSTKVDKPDEGGVSTTAPSASGWV